MRIKQDGPLTLEARGLWLRLLGLSEPWERDPWKGKQRKRDDPKYRRVIAVMDRAWRRVERRKAKGI